MKQMQWNALNIKTTAKQVWLYFQRGTTTNLQMVLNTPKKSLLKSPLKSSHKKKILTKFSYSKKSQNWTFPTQKNRLILPVTWNLEYPPPPPGISVKSLNGERNKDIILYSHFWVFCLVKLPSLEDVFLFCDLCLLFVWLFPEQGWHLFQAEWTSTTSSQSFERKKTTVKV